MKKFITTFLVLLFVAGYAYSAWDPTKPATTDIAANSQNDLRSNFNAINAVFGAMISNGTAVSSTATELNLLNGMTTELNLLDNVTVLTQQFNAWTAGTIGSSTQVTADGILSCYINAYSGDINADIRTDSSNPPTTRRVWWDRTTGTGAFVAIPLTCPVRANDYYLVTITTGCSTGSCAYWLPFVQ